MTDRLRALAFVLDIVARSGFALAAYATVLLALGLLPAEASLATPLLLVAAAIFIFTPLFAMLPFPVGRAATFALPLIGMTAVLFAVVELVGGELARATLTVPQALLLGSAIAAAVLGTLIAAFFDDALSLAERATRR